MCGIAGIWTDNSNLDIQEITSRMTNALQHRGPDSHGNWFDTANNLGLGQRRLSILELSELGHQPMVSSNKRWVISLNGEIYNFRQVRDEILQAANLNGIQISFRGNSDTEVVLEAISVFGVKEAVSKIVGMFAIAVYDTKQKTLYLIRDRMGEKPLYYGHTNGAFFFCSELKAIYKSGIFNNSLDMNAISLYFGHRNIPSPYTPFSGVYKLTPGTILKISNNGLLLAEPEPYWSIKQVLQTNQNEKFSLSEDAMLEKLEYLLKQSINEQMCADVPVGAFLSGGIDSSLIVSLMRSLNNNQINTFTIGFSEEKYNEAEDAKKIAEILKTNHTELYITPEDAIKVIPDLAKINDEPFADSSQIPTYLLSKLTKEKITVCLSGDAGDELFAGYKKHSLALSRWMKLNKQPKLLRSILGGCLSVLPVELINKTWDIFSIIFQNDSKFRELDSGGAGDKLHRKAHVICSSNFLDMYKISTSPFKIPSVVPNLNEKILNLNDDTIMDLTDDKVLIMTIFDMLNYLPNTILPKVDLAAMANSLEVRAPFLDHRIVEFSLSIPGQYKIKDNKAKWPLRQILYKYIPKHLVDKPKKGFSVPISSWLRNDLRDWAESLLDEKFMVEQGILNSKIVKKLWREHLTGKRDWKFILWNVLMFQSWYMEHRNFK